MINQRNYEEYFILYVDNELDAAEKAMVEAFAAQHPHLAEELDLLMNTKLTPDDVSFTGKEELLSPAMKVNAVDEALLLYIDNELSLAERKTVEEKMAANEEYSLQHALLLQTKLNAADVVSYPNKKELYRHEKKVMPFGPWMRIAAAVIVLLLSSLFYFRSGEKVLPANNREVAKNTEEKRKPVNARPSTTVEKTLQQTASIKEKTVVQKAPANGQTTTKESSLAPNLASVKKAKSVNEQKESKQMILAKQKQQDITSVAQQFGTKKQFEKLRVNANHFERQLQLTPPVAVNKTIAPSVVTSKADSSYNKQNATSNNPEVDWAVETEKKTPARGFFRKVSRFIERKTGIGTANADDELLIGAVALKLK